MKRLRELPLPALLERAFRACYGPNPYLWPMLAITAMIEAERASRRGER